MLKLKIEWLQYYYRNAKYLLECRRKSDPCVYSKTPTLEDAKPALRLLEYWGVEGDFKVVPLRQFKKSWRKFTRYIWDHPYGNTFAILNRKQNKWDDKPTYRLFWVCTHFEGCGKEDVKGYYKIIKAIEKDLKRKGVKYIEPHLDYVNNNAEKLIILFYLDSCKWIENIYNK